MNVAPLDPAVCELVLGSAPDRQDISRRLDRIAAAWAAAGLGLDSLPPAGHDILRLCCQRAPYLAGLLARDPTRLHRLARDGYLRREKPAPVMRQELAEHLRGTCGADGELDEAALKAGLRTYRADEMVRLGCRELGLGNPVEVGRELAHLADACFDAAIAAHTAALSRRHGAPRFIDDAGTERPAEFAVIGMGKLGGEELNFSSDVDVIYVYSSDQGSAGSRSLHEFFCRLSERVTAALAEVTGDELVFRVDLRLRPEGSRGAIANSLPSLERYYESWGRPWERQAWIKARPCAGSQALGQAVLNTLRPFVYPRHGLHDPIEQVRALNQRIKSELGESGLESGFDVKNGVGGIREVEFFVQTLQMVHGGHNPALRARPTLVALDQLMFAGLITEIEHRTLGDAYRFLRRVEHLLQLEAGRQTQRLPVDPEALARLAYRLDLDGTETFRRTLAGHTDAVAALFATLGDQDEGPRAEVLALLTGEADAAREEQILAQLGFREPGHAHQLLEIGRRRPGSPLSRTATGAPARLGPGLIAELSTCPDPDQALGYMIELVSRRGTFTSLWRLFDENPPLMRLICSLFGTSDFLAKAFVNHPELIDSLLLAGQASARLDAAALERALDTRLADPRLGEAATEEEQQWNALAEFKLAQVLRIGLADIAGELAPEEVCTELSLLAEVCLRRACVLVQGGLVARHGVPRHADTGAPASLALLALGKLGGRELGYASDLDILFVYGGDGTSDGPHPLDNVTYMSRAAQRLVRGLHMMHPGGRLYELDTRLRPEGQKGLLVSSLAGWVRYHREQARQWERQALTKLRPLAGDLALGEVVTAAAHECVYGAPPGQRGLPAPAELARAIRDMRERIERELGGGQRRRDLKTGRGGLVDIEFATQYLQLVHGHAHPVLRSTSTLEVLGHAAELAIADRHDCQLLAEGYRFLRALEHRLRIVHDRSEQVLPGPGIELDKLARRCGYASGGALDEAYRHWTEDIRGAFARLLSA
jgi:glutamate-ammonia-ligase adenylyltransferase